MRCPHCKNHLIQKSGDATKVRVQGPLQFGGNSVCKGRCYWCKQEVEIPLELKKAEEAVDEESFTIPAMLVKA